jgi:hypothetical protein
MTTMTCFSGRFPNALEQQAWHYTFIGGNKKVSCPMANPGSEARERKRYGPTFRARVHANRRGAMYKIATLLLLARRGIHKFEESTKSKGQGMTERGTGKSSKHSDKQ